jgi:hypothetical protein
LGLQEEADNL